MLKGVLIMCAILVASITASFAEYMPDISKFPEDKAVIPAHLENMRPGQIRDAAAKGTVCLLPVGTLESGADASPLGMDLQLLEDALMKLATERKAVIAPPVWYSPTGYLYGKPEDGTFDMPGQGFVPYIEEVMLGLRAFGFSRVEVVIVNGPQRKDTPLYAAISFALGDIFNDHWKDPVFGKNWYLRDDRGTLPYNRISIRFLPKTEMKRTAEPMRLPMRLEQMTPSEVREALRRGLPCFVPVGVIECHGNQNPVACDAFEAQEPLVMAASKAPVVVGPTIWYGPTAFACGGPELGSLEISGPAFLEYAKGVVSGLAAMGFKNIYFVQCHQGGGAQRTGLVMAIQDYYSQLYAKPGYGPGWMSRLKEGDPRPPHMEMIDPPGGQYDHAGKNETSWMLALRGQYTDMSLLRQDDFNYCWLGKANTATAAWGQEMTEKMVERYLTLFAEKTVAPVAAK